MSTLWQGPVQFALSPRKFSCSMFIPYFLRFFTFIIIPVSCRPWASLPTLEAFQQEHFLSLSSFLHLYLFDEKNQTTFWWFVYVLPFELPLFRWLGQFLKRWIVTRLKEMRKSSLAFSAMQIKRASWIRSDSDSSLSGSDYSLAQSTVSLASYHPLQVYWYQRSVPTSRNEQECKIKILQRFFESQMNWK